MQNFEHARTKEQIEVMKKAQQNGGCPFCWAVLENHHPKPIIKKGKWWWVSENGWPYEGTKLHLMFFYKDHISKISEINPDAFEELQELLTWIEKKYKIKGGGFFIRFGETERTGSSVQHLHAQLVIGNSKKDNKSEALRVKLGYKKKK